LDFAERQRRRELALVLAKKASVGAPRRPPVGDVIVQMLQERTKENAAQKKADLAAQKKADQGKAHVAVTGGMAATPNRSATCDADLATPAKKKKTEKEGVSMNTKKSGSVAGKTEKGVGVAGKDWQPPAMDKDAVRYSPLCYNHYPTRDEIVLRSGLRGKGQSKTIKYGKGPTSRFKTSEDAVAWAELWVESQTDVW